MAASRVAILLALIFAISFLLDSAFCMRLKRDDVVSTEGEKDESNDLDPSKTEEETFAPDDESESSKEDNPGSEGDDEIKDDEPSDDGKQRPSDDESSDDGEKRPSDGEGEEPSDDGEKRPSDGDDEESSHGGDKRRSTDEDVGKPSGETTSESSVDPGKTDAKDDTLKGNSSSEDKDGDFASSTANEGAILNKDYDFNPSESEDDQNSTDDDLMTSDRWFPFHGGFTFDSPFFSFEQVEQYFRKLERAMGNIFRQAMHDVVNNTESFRNSSDRVMEVDGQKYKVHTAVIKGGNENSSVYIEVISAVPINETRKRRSLW